MVALVSPVKTMVSPVKTVVFLLETNGFPKMNNLGVPQTEVQAFWSKAFILELTQMSHLGDVVPRSQQQTGAILLILSTTAGM